MKAVYVKTEMGFGLPSFIKFRMKLVNDSQLQVAMLDCRVRLTFRSEEFHFDIGYLQTDLVSTVLRPGDERTIDAEWHPSLRDLNLVEEKRAGKDFGFLMSLSVAMSEFKSAGEVSLESLQTKTRIDVSDSDGSTFLEIPRSRWTQILEGIGYRRYIDLSLEIPPPPGDKIFAACIKHLESARRNLAHGQYEDTATSCRRAINGIEDLVKKKAISLSDVFGENRGEQFDGIMKRAKSFLSGPTHTQTLDYPGGEFALLLTTSLVNYIMREYSLKQS